MPYKKNRKTNIDKALIFLKRHLLTILVVLVFLAGATATIMIMRNEERTPQGVEDTIPILQPASEIRLAMYNPESFNALSSSDEDVVYINQLVYSYLFRLDNTLNIVPDIVESYIPNRETGSVELTLKAGITFSDGTAMNAYDVEYTIGVIQSLGTQSPYYNYANKIAAISVTGRDTLYIDFVSKNDASLDNLVFPIVSAENYNYNTFNVGGGPYKYAEYVEEKYLMLEPNEQYYGDVPKTPVYIALVKNKEILPGLTTLDDVTCYLSKEESADDIAAGKMLRCRYIPSGELEYVGFNCRNSLCSDSVMRQAISYAIDRNEIVSDDYGNGAVVSDSLYFPGFMGVEEGNAITYDPKKASELLNSLGYMDTNEDKILEDSSGNPISLRLLVSKDISSRKEAAATIVKGLSSVGIGVEIVELPQGELMANLATGNFDIYIAGIKMDKQFKMSELFGSANYGGFNEATVMNLVAQLEQCLSADEQKGVFIALKPLLNTEIPYLSIGYKTYSFISVPSLAVTDSPMFFDPYRNLGTWVWQKKVSAEE